MAQKQDDYESTHTSNICVDSQPVKGNRDEGDEPDSYYSDLFSKSWNISTSDYHSSLFGFRRYRTSHLINLRFLEAEIHQMDRDLYQAGLKLDQPLDRDHALDRLGLKQAKRDSSELNAEANVDKASIMRLRGLIKEYDESLKAFNTVMSMETFSLADDIDQAGNRQDLHAFEKSKTRMLRVDLPLRRNSRDPVQHFLRKGLRRLWYALNSWKLHAEDEEKQQKRRGSSCSKVLADWNRTYQNTARIAEAITRFLIGMGTGAALVIPLVVLSYQNSDKSRLLVVVLFISFFCFLLSLFSKASNYEIMAASAAYAAVLTVLVSNNTYT